MRIRIGYCGSHSITGAIQDLVLRKGLMPDVIEVEVGHVPPLLDLNAELESARRTYASKPFTITLAG